MRISRRSSALFTALSIAPLACFVYLQGVQNAYAGPINTMALCGNASVCIFDNNIDGSSLAAEQAFVAAVGSNPLGQANFGNLSAGAYPNNGGPVYSADGQPISVVTGGPAGGGTDVYSRGIGFNLTYDYGSATSQYYYGYNYADTTTGDTGVCIYPGYAGASGCTPGPASGFFGVISSTPLPESEDSQQIYGSRDGGADPTGGGVYVDDVLYAGGPGISASNPLYPDAPASCSAETATCVLDFLVFTTVGSFLDPATADAYTYQTLDGSLFTFVGGFPSGFTGPFDISSGGTNFGLFSPNTLHLTTFSCDPVL
jgi:hypothetical protein